MGQVAFHLGNREQWEEGVLHAGDLPPPPWHRFDLQVIPLQLGFRVWNHLG